MLDELATGWSRFSVDLIPGIGPRDLQPRVRPQHRLRPSRSRVDAARVGNSSGGAAVLAPVLPRRRDRAGGDAGEPAATRAHVRRHQPVIRLHGAADASLRRHLHPPQASTTRCTSTCSRSSSATSSRSGSTSAGRSRAPGPAPERCCRPSSACSAYVADAYLDGRSDDILLQPVSISFDQLHETAEYAAYARGGEKTPEGLSWLYNFIKAQGERNYGKIYVRFPEAVSMRQYLGAPHGPIAEDKAAKRLAMQKMAIEVAWRILRATPVNATGLVSALLLTHPRRRAQPRPAAPHAAGLAGLPGAQADTDDQQRVAAAHPRGRPGGGRRAVQRASGHPRRQRPRAGLADRPRGRARGRVLPQLADPRVPGDLDRRAGARLRRAAPNPTAWRRSGRRRCGFATC